MLRKTGPKAINFETSGGNPVASIVTTHALVSGFCYFWHPGQ
jgi:hypothetical protein